MKYTSISIVFIFMSAFIYQACTKEVPKEVLDKQKSLKNEMPGDSVHTNTQKNSNENSDMTSDEKKGDNKVDLLSKEADDADAQYQRTKSEGDKKTAIDKQMAAANYLMFRANLSPKKKYRPALKRYRRILELDPKNQEAEKNKKMIEDIYSSMGIPIPEN